MSVQLPEKTGQEQDADAPRMVHWTFHWQPYRALCGATLIGEDVPDGTPLDCIVCAEMMREFA